MKSVPMKKIAGAVSIVLAVAAVLGIVYFGISSTTPSFASTPILLYNSTITPYPDLCQGTTNASQGLLQQLNLTLTEYDFSTPIEVPIEDLRITAYDSAIDYGNNWNAKNWNTSIDQTAVFNYSFSLKTLTLQPNASNSTIITINWSNNAPTGRYIIYVDLGTLKFLSKQGPYDQTYGSSFELGIVVAPKVNST